MWVGERQMGAPESCEVSLSRLPTDTAQFVLPGGERLTGQVLRCRVYISLDPWGSGDRSSNTARLHIAMKCDPVVADCWACAACTMENPSSSRSCNICGSPRPNEQPPPPESRDLLMGNLSEQDCFGASTR